MVSIIWPSVPIMLVIFINLFIIPCTIHITVNINQTTDGIINDEVLDNLYKIKIYPIKIESEKDLANEIARISNISIKPGYQIQDEKRLLNKDEAYGQISHSASLFKAILEYVENID